MPKICIFLLMVKNEEQMWIYQNFHEIIYLLTEIELRKDGKSMPNQNPTGSIPKKVKVPSRFV